MQDRLKTWTKALMMIPGLSGFEGNVRRAIRKELELFNPDLADKDEVIVINKADLFQGQPQFLADVKTEFRKLLEKGPKKLNRPLLPKEPMSISCASGEGIHDLIHVIWEKLSQ